MPTQVTHAWEGREVAVVACTDVGRKRGRNEDAFFICREEPLLVVADGMGGYDGGDEASALAVETMAAFFTATREDDDATWPFKMDREHSVGGNRLVTGMKLSNLRIHERAARLPPGRRMGSTMVGLLFGHGEVHVAHVGDSRVYRYRNGELLQLTEDHSLLNDWIRMTHPTPDQINRFPHKNVIVRALGVQEQVQVDLASAGEARPGDTFLLCSDGLSSMLDDEQIAAILQVHEVCDPHLEEACAALIEAANDAGGIDNITVALARVC